MRIAVSAIGPVSSSAVYYRFGRAPYFVIHDTETGLWEAVANTPNMTLAHGAGVQSAQMLIQARVRAVLTGHCGANALRALHAGSIVAHIGADGTAQEALEAYRSGNLPTAEAADVEGHW